MNATTATNAPLSLVTGACGFMGTHMVETLVAAGHRVRATDLASALGHDDRKAGRFPSVLQKLGVEVVASDMTRPESLAPLVQGVDYVFHVAAVFSYSAPRELLERVNVEGTRALLELLENEKQLKRLVVWGAGGVYGLPNATNLPFREDMPADPPNAYLESKSEQEKLVMEFGRAHELPYSIIRPTTVYGPRAVYGGGQLFSSFDQMKVVAMPRSLTGRVPLVHVRDVCGAALHLAQHPGAAGQIYNVNDDSQMTTVELSRYLAELLGRPFVGLPGLSPRGFRGLMTAAARAEKLVSRYVTHKPLQIEEDSVAYLGRDFAYANEKLKNTGYRFQYPDPRVGLRETAEWYRQEGWVGAGRAAPASAVYRSLCHASFRELEAAMKAGTRPRLDDLAGAEFRGFNTPAFTAVLGIRKFKKGFLRGPHTAPGTLDGHNVRTKQSKFEGPWQDVLRGGEPLRHGFYVVAEPGENFNPYPRALLLDYSRGKNAKVDPSSLLRDYLVQVDPKNRDLFLGKAYLALGRRRIFVSYFVLERVPAGRNNQ